MNDDMVMLERLGSYLRKYTEEVSSLIADAARTDVDGPTIYVLLKQIEQTASIAQQAAYRIDQVATNLAEAVMPEDLRNKR